MIQPAMIDPPPDSRPLTRGRGRGHSAATGGISRRVNRLILYLLEGTNFVTEFATEWTAGGSSGLTTEAKLTIAPPGQDRVRNADCRCGWSRYTF